MMAKLVVIAVYLAVLVLILFPPKELTFVSSPTRWWRDVRLWAAFVIVAQIAVYAVWA